MKHLRHIKEYHKLAHLPAPLHPLISLVNYKDVNYGKGIDALKWKQDYYTIGLKRQVAYKMFYGQQTYDFDEGLMTFVAPNQVLSLSSNPNIKHKPSGWLLLIHPDFLWNTSLANMPKRYKFFGYSVNEALFLSEKEEAIVQEILQNIKEESQHTIDKFSHPIVIAHLELLLNYAERFYERQFITRNIVNHQVVTQVEDLLKAYFESDAFMDHGLPSVIWMAEQLNLSPNYLSSMLKTVTGQSTQQHIHNYVIMRAKEQLSTTNASISEIAYSLGFEHSPSFNKLFKSKTQMTPSEFRRQFN